MAGNLHFDVTANDNASGEFAAAAAAARNLLRQLQALDGKRVTAKLILDTPPQAPLAAVVKQLDAIDGRTARAKVDQAGAESATVQVAGFGASLKALPNTVRSKVAVDIDQGVSDRLAGIAGALGRIGSVSGAAAAGVQRFRSAAQVMMDPAQLPIITRVSDAISSKFHKAVDTASVGVAKLGTGLRGLRTSLLAVGAAGNAVEVLGGVASALGEIGPAALLAPGALAAVGVAFTVGKLAATGFSDALTGSAKKQRQAFAAMGPEAQKLVTALKSLGPAANSFRQAVQDTAVKGFSEDIKRLAGQYLPMLRPQLVGIAGELNAMGRGLMSTFSSARVSGQLGNMIKNVRWSLEGIAPAAGNAAAGVVRLAEFGTRYMLGFGRSVSDVAERFRTWVERTTGNGQMQQWIDGALHGFRDLGTIIGNVAAITGTVFKAFSLSGGNALDTATRLTTQIRLFLQSTDGQQGLRSLADTVRVVGDNVSQVLGVALRAATPLLVALGPAAQALANALGGELTAVIERLAPLFTRLATALSANPELLSQLAHAAALLVIGFQPAVAIIGVMASVLQGLVLARVVSLALGQLGQSGTVLGRVLMALVSPMALIREALPLIARGAGYLVASLGIAAGPVGVLIVAFTTLYASSSQFRDAVNSLGQVLGGLFVRALQQAGQVLAGTVRFLSDFAAGIGVALGGLRDFGSTVASSFGPAGRLVGDVLTSIFDHLSILPGAALAAFAAFKTLALITPIFATASAAVAGFATRLAAVQVSNGVLQGAVNGSAAAVGAFGTALSKVGAALPLIGIAVVALGAAYSEFGSKADEIAQKQITGQLSMREALEATRAQVDKNLLFEVRAGQQAQMNAQAEAEYRTELEKQILVLPQMEQLKARAAMAQTELNDAVIQFGPNSQQAAAAAATYQAAQDRLTVAQDQAKTAAQSHSEAIIEQQRILEGAVNADINYQNSLDQLAQAQDRAKEAVQQHGAGSREASAAFRDTTQAALDVARAAGEKAKADATAAGAANADEIAARAQNDELLRLAQQASGPTKDALLQAAGATNGLKAAEATAEIQARLHKDELGRLAGQATGPLAQAMRDAKANFDQLGGANASAEQKARAQKDELQRLANMASGPVRSELQRMADQIRTLPNGQFTISAKGELSALTNHIAQGGKTLATGGVVPDWARPQVQRYADGGVTPGYTPGRDVHTFISPTAGRLELSGGEAIMRPEVTRGIGSSAIHGLNRAARGGGPGAVRKWLARHGPRIVGGLGGDASDRLATGGVWNTGRVQRFAMGGITRLGVQPLNETGNRQYTATRDEMVRRLAAQMAAERKKYADMLAAQAAAGGGGPVTAGAQAALDWGRTQVGKPYVWGAVGPGGYDAVVENALIYGPFGATPIQDLKPGQLVWSMTKDGKAEARPVVALVDQGEKEVFKVRTRNRTVEASAKHPFPRLKLYPQAATLGGRGADGTWGVEWVYAEDLQPGDTIVTFQGDEDTVRAADLMKDDDFPQDLAWLLGVFIGDGCINVDALRICVYGELREQVSEVSARHWGTAGKKHDGAGLIINKAAAARWMQANGFDRKAHEKRVPSIVWSWQSHVQRAFLAGYMAADGHQPRDPAKYGDIVYKSCSERLIREVRALHTLLGDGVSNVGRQDRTKPIIIKGREVKHARPLYSCTVRHGSRATSSLQGGTSKRHKGAREMVSSWQSALGVQQVLAVESGGVRPTWDIEVEETHNFVADGLLVHNCSGFMSALVNVMRGRNPYSRVGSTASFPWAGFQPGGGPGLSIGAFKGSPGHMAGTIGGTNVESSGSVGVRVGGGARGVSNSMFNIRAHLADKGGRIPHGHAALNLSGRAERMLTGRQDSNLMRLTHGIERARTASAPGGAPAAVMVSPAAAGPAVRVDVDMARVVAELQAVGAVIRAAAQGAHDDAETYAAGVRASLTGVASALRPNVAATQQAYRQSAEFGRV